MDYIAVIETTQDMKDGVRLPYVRQELVAQTLALAGALDQTGYIDYVHGGRHHALRLAHFGQNLKPLVRNIGGTEVRLDGTEREIGALGLPGTHAVEQC